jgi:peptidoglycan/LPS O-acetylase OafA/YrhL
MSENEFEVFGLNSARVSVIYGVILVVFAVLISLISGSDSLTSYIPAMFGLPILILGLIAVWAPSKQKLVMHINVVIGLLIFLAGLSVIPSLVSGVNLNTNLWANVSKLFMSLTGALYLTICVKSFIFIRRKRSFTETK